MIFLQTKLLSLHQVCTNVTIKDNVKYVQYLSCQTTNHTIQPCDHEKADSRIALHLYNAMKNDARNILVCTVDSDVIVILVGLFSNFHPDTSVWVAFGTGKFFRYYKIYTIFQVLGPEKSKALLFFHAFTGCDTTSQFLNKGKKSATLGVLVQKLHRHLWALLSNHFTQSHRTQDCLRYWNLFWLISLPPSGEQVLVTGVVGLKYQYQIK